MGKSRANKKQKLPEFKGMAVDDLNHSKAKKENKSAQKVVSEEETSSSDADVEQMELAPTAKRHKANDSMFETKKDKKFPKKVAEEDEESSSESGAEQMEVVSPSKQHAPEDFAVLTNLPKFCTQGEVQALLSSRGVATDRVHMIYAPVAVVARPKGNSQHLFEALNGFHYKNQKLCCMPVVGNSAAPLFAVTEKSKPTADATAVDSKSLYISKVPFDTTETELAGVVKDKQASITLMKTFRHKPDHVSGAKVTYPTESQAAEALKKLQGVELRGMNLVVKPFNMTGSKKARDEKTSSLTPQHKILSVSNLPFAMTQAQVAEHFPDAEKVHLVTRQDGSSTGKCILTFATAEDCARASQAYRNKLIGGRPIKTFREASVPLMNLSEKRSDFVVRVWNIPYTTSSDDLKAHYPEAQRVVMIKGENKKPKGTALVIFQNASQCQEAVKKTATLRINGRQLGAEFQQPRPAQHSAKSDAANNGSMTRKRQADDNDEEEEAPRKKKVAAVEENDEQEDEEDDEGDEDEEDDDEDEDDDEEEEDSSD